MSLFIPEYFITKLQSLTFDSIDTLTLYINTNMNELDRILIIWEEEYSKCNKLHQIVLLKLLSSYFKKYESKEVEKLFNKYYKEYIKEHKDSDINKHLEMGVEAAAGNSILKTPTTDSAVRAERIIKKVRFSNLEPRKNFQKEELVRRIEEYYDVKERLITYLEEFIDELKK